MGTRDGCASAAQVWVRRLLGRVVLGPQMQHLGHVRDVVAHRRATGASVTGVIVDVGGHRSFVPVAALGDLQRAPLVLRAFSPRPARSRRPGECLLVQDALGRPIMTGATAAPSRIGDIALRRTPSGWVVWAADTRGAVARLLGARRRLVGWDALGMRTLVAPAVGFPCRYTASDEEAIRWRGRSDCR
ncbi:hypothetical protein ACU61A_16910 [Pseudonocardia sichuanensis]